jgi:Bifunctional DNA primase/polymerase, N-terminal
MFVVDADRRSGGEQTLARWRREHGPADTVIAATGDGWHLWFQWPGEPELRAQDVGPGVHIRGAGHYAVLPPSRHRSGVRYRWLRDPFEHEIAEAPDWLLDLARAAGRREPIVASDVDDGYRIPDGQRYPHLIRFAGLLRSMGLPEEAVVRCGLVFLQECCAQDPPMDLAHAERELRDVARRYPPQVNR